MPAAYADSDYFCTLTVMGECLEDGGDIIRVEYMGIYPATLRDNQTMRADVALRNVVLYHFYDAYFVFQLRDDQNRTLYIYTQPRMDIADGHVQYISLNFTLNPGVYSAKVIVWQELSADVYNPLLLHPKERLFAVEKNTR
jgi:hypothetical protein